MKIGVNEGVVIAEAVISEENKTLELKFQYHTDLSTTKESALTMLSEGSDTSGQEAPGYKHIFFMPQLQDMDGEDRDGRDIYLDLTIMKNVMVHILMRFMKKRSIVFEPFKGIKIDKNISDERVFKLLTNEKVMKRVYKNIVTQFLKMVKPFIGDPKLLSRLLLVRRSKNSHYATIRRRFLDSNPFWEDANIPVSQSSLYVSEGRSTTKLHEGIEYKGTVYVPKFNVYEISNGLDDDTPVPTEDGGDSVDIGAEDEIELTDSMFDSDEEEETPKKNKDTKKKSKKVEEVEDEDELNAEDSGYDDDDSYDLDEGSLDGEDDEDDDEDFTFEDEE